MDRYPSMKGLQPPDKNCNYVIKNKLQILITVLMCTHSVLGFLRCYKHHHLAYLIPLSFFSFYSLLPSCNITMSFVGIENLVPLSLKPVMAQGQNSQPSSLPSTTNDSVGSSFQPQVSSNDSAGTNATSLAPGIQIAYPRGWIANDLGNGIVRFSTPLRTDLMRFTVNVVDLPPPLENMTIDKLLEINLNNSKQQLSNFSLVESNTTTLTPENQSAHKIVYTNTNKDPSFPLKFRTMQIFTIKDGQIFTISYVSEDSQYLRFLPTIERMIDSITFKKS
jgi:hypothetical protein